MGQIPIGRFGLKHQNCSFFKQNKLHVKPTLHTSNISQLVNSSHQMFEEDERKFSNKQLYNSPLPQLQSKQYQITKPTTSQTCQRLKFNLSNFTIQMPQQ